MEREDRSTGDPLRSFGTNAGLVGLRDPASDLDGISAGFAMDWSERRNPLQAQVRRFRLHQRLLAEQMVGKRFAERGIREPMVGETPINESEIACARRNGYHIERETAKRKKEKALK